MNEGSKEFTAPRFAYSSPMALKLFLLEGVNRVFYGKDFISVSKDDATDWNILKPLVYSVIME
jgi:hypothetical protein